MQIKIEAKKMSERTLYFHHQLMTGKGGKGVKVACDLTQPPSALVVRIDDNRRGNARYSVSITEVIEAVHAKHTEENPVKKKGKK